MSNDEEVNTQNGDMELLAKLEAANKKLEADEKSLLIIHNGKSGYSSTCGHSRKGSGSSVISSCSVNSSVSNLQFDDEDDDPEELWKLWGKLATDWDNIIRKKPALVKELVHKGIPQHFRGIAWQLLCQSHHSNAKEVFSELLKKSSPYEKVIRRDITRTYPQHELFKEKNGLGQESLYNVMKAYSIHDREVGYCQGSGFIVGLLLMNMPEEDAFSVLVQLMTEYRLRELYKPSMAELGVLLFQLECMLQEQMPSLYNHFQLQNFCVSMFASSWFLTLFTMVLPLSVACRIFDVFLLEGMELIFRVSFAILQQAQEDLLSMDMEGMLHYFQKRMPAIYLEDPDRLMNGAYSIKYNAKKMKKLEKEYNALKSKEQEDQVELRRLRTENRLLRQRIDNLEKETVSLADRLIQDQVDKAQKEEECFSLRRNVSELRQHNTDVTQNLHDAEEKIQQLTRTDEASDDSGVSLSQGEDVQALKDQVASLLKDGEEASSIVKQMRNKISELENTNRNLQRDPSEELEKLQEELIACKMREAEATLGMKELQQRVFELDKYVQKVLEKLNSPPDGQKPSKDKLRQMQEELMNTRLREANAFSELQEMKQRVMELETQNQISGRQSKRQEEEIVKLEQKIEKDEEEKRELQHRITEHERVFTDLGSKRKEDQMMSKIKDVEHSQMLAEMRRRIAELEIENQEYITAGQIQSQKGYTQELENKISDLQEEVMHLKMTRKLQTISSLAQNRSIDTEESDCENEDCYITNSGKIKKSSTCTYFPQRQSTLTESESSDIHSEADFSMGSNMMDSMMCSLTAADIEKLRLKYPMSESMMQSVTDADIEKLTLNPMTESMICDGSSFFDVRKFVLEDEEGVCNNDNFTYSEGLYDYNGDNGTVKRKTSKSLNTDNSSSRNNSNIKDENSSQSNNNNDIDNSLVSSSLVDN